MLADAMIRAAEEESGAGSRGGGGGGGASASAIYKTILGPAAAPQLDAITRPLAAAMETGSVHAAEGLEARVAALFEAGVAAWREGVSGLTEGRIQGGVG